MEEVGGRWRLKVGGAARGRLKSCNLDLGLLRRRVSAKPWELPGYKWGLKERERD
jgi:hypothetical protein